MSWQIAIDEPKSFELLAPSSVEQAIEWAHRHGEDAAILAGGCDLLDKLKNQWATPRYVINLKTVAGLKKIESNNSMIKLGALTTLGEIERHSQLKQLAPALVQAASRVATPQIRNLGTIGGNLLQDSRCPYYRGAWQCYRKGGIICDAVRGINTEHALFGGDRCFTVTPSDLAPVMVALDGKAKTQSPRGESQIDLVDFFMLPKDDIRHMHRLAKDEILTEVELPLRPNQRSTFIKYAMREAWDFALASIAVSITQEGSTIRNARVVFGAVAPVPWRSHEVEQVIEGKSLNDSLIEAAALASVRAAEPLSHNEYKIGLMKKLVRAALTELSK
ncbi:MAG: xanthine dehydrogenase family protein subunit M [Acidobacteriota bacterium]